MDNYRNKTRKVQIGDVCIGGGEKIAIQSMTNTKTEDVEADPYSTGGGYTF